MTGMELELGIDLGATNIAAALVDADNQIVQQASLPTQPERPAAEILADIVRLAEGLVRDTGRRAQDIAAIGLGVPGIADPQSGVVYLCPNLGWQDLPVRELLAAGFQQVGLAAPVFIANDANCAALAELYLGALRGCQNAVLVTLGSGIGGGLIVNGQLQTGAHGAAGEVGHMAVELHGPDCPCGSTGCWERFASAPALRQLAAERGLTADTSLSTDRNLTTGDPLSTARNLTSAVQLSTEQIIAAAQAGDRQAQQVFAEYIYNLARGLASIISMVDPEVVALGGGLSAAGDFLLTAVRDELALQLPFQGYPTAEIVLATLGNAGGLVGAALYARQEQDKLTKN
ncbi:MAG: ROK family protein [Actinomycetia bacterium]|nr:ROK family protein [Actinomycetes bacterium]